MAQNTQETLKRMAEKVAIAKEALNNFSVEELASIIDTTPWKLSNKVKKKVGSE